MRVTLNAADAAEWRQHELRTVYAAADVFAACHTMPIMRRFDAAADAAVIFATPR